MTNSNLLIIIIGVIVLIAIIYFINKNNNQPIPNNGIIPQTVTNLNNKHYQKNRMDNIYSVNSKNRMDNTYSANSKNRTDNTYSPDMEHLLSSDDGVISPANSDSIQYSPVSGYDNSEKYSTNENNEDFTYKKQKFTKRTPQDVHDLFDVEKMKPQEQEDWFDVIPLENTKKIKGTHLIHPKEHLGINTTGGSKRGGTHDIRGDIPNPQLDVGPWGISTSKPSNSRGLC